MKLLLPEKSRIFEDHIHKIADIIVNAAHDKIAFVILFGSFARGDWVRDRYSEGNVVYEYASDFDFLVVTNPKENDEESFISFDLDRKIKREIDKKIVVREDHKIHLVIESFNYVNSELEKGRYFFSDIKKEGILLFNSGQFVLADPRPLSLAKMKAITQADCEHWLGKAEGFSISFKAVFAENLYSDAAFQLHQLAESLYNCALLTLTGYKPKTHDLEELNQLCCVQSNVFLTIFPVGDEKHKNAFKMLQRAYVEARYNKDYKITKEALEYLLERINRLKEIVVKICKVHIQPNSKYLTSDENS
ncbi:MAG: HEPN domain-containing protein [Pseudomonadota bacterium]